MFRLEDIYFLPLWEKEISWYILPMYVQPESYAIFGLNGHLGAQIVAILKTNLPGQEIDTTCCMVIVGSFA
jgi:hypothetical protein